MQGPITVAARMNDNTGGGFLPSSRVRMSDGTEKRCDEIQPGDVDYAGHVIETVISIDCDYAFVVRLEGPLRPANAALYEGGITRWHPVLDGQAGWQLPVRLGPIHRVNTEKVFNFVLRRGDVPQNEDRPGTLIVDGNIVCTWGHDMVAPVVRHPYFGKKMEWQRNILEDLQELPNYRNGYVFLPLYPFITDRATDMVVAMQPLN